mgnify:CR=1 FL=1
MVAGYFYQFEPVPILQNLGIVLFLLCVGLEAGPSFFRAFKQHGRRFISNVLVLLAISWVNTVAIIFLSGIPIGLGLGLFAGSFTSSPALISALQFSPDEQVIFGYGVAYPFGLIGVILFISIAVRLLRGKMEAEIRGHSNLHTAVFRLENEALHGQLIRNVIQFHTHDVVVSGLLRDLSVHSPSGSTVLQMGDLLRLEGLPENVEAAGADIGEEVHEAFENQAELDTRSIVVENTSVINRSLRDLGLQLRFNATLTRIIRANVEFVPSEDQALADAQAPGRDYFLPIRFINLLPVATVAIEALGDSGQVVPLGDHVKTRRRVFRSRLRCGQLPIIAIVCFRIQMFNIGIGGRHDRHDERRKPHHRRTVRAQL